jgi:3-dehydroquinate dehydratase/shikimate dehydrogenase
MTLSHTSLGLCPGPTAAGALVATLDEPVQVNVGIRRRLPKGVAWVQVRADRVGDIPADWLREDFGGRLLYSLEASGACETDGLDRLKRLSAAAAAGYDLIELDGERDIGTGVLEAIPPEKRLICWRGKAASEAELASRFRRLSRIDARFYLLVAEARRAADGLAPLLFLRSVGRNDVTAYADGEMGLWSRILASRLGAPQMFVGSLGGSPEPSGNPGPGTMIGDFGLPFLPAFDRICGIAGALASKSLSPSLHNAAYRALGYPALFLPFPVDSFAGFWREFIESRALEQIGLSWQGLTVAAPNKEVAAALPIIRSRAALKAASANVVFRRGPTWAATTTDPIGVLAHLDRRMIPGQRAAVIGCGGSGRAIAHALGRARASVTLVNRCQERGEQASRLLGLPFASLSGFSADGYDVIVNATPVGMRGDALPFSIRRVARHAVVVDLVYTQGTTPLVDSARAHGVRVVEGREVLRAQVERQFTRMTGLTPPPGLVAERLELEPSPLTR